MAALLRGRAYPLDLFIRQVSAALDLLDSARGSWKGPALPARVAAVVQRLAYKHFPLDQDQSLGLLRILDVLVDLDYRRSAALVQSEAFRAVRVCLLIFLMRRVDTILSTGG